MQLAVHITGDDLESISTKDSWYYHSLSSIKSNCRWKNIDLVTCYYTDVFVLVCHCNDLMNSQKKLYMAEFSWGKKIISLENTLKHNKSLILSFLPTPDFLSWDTERIKFGIGKKKSLQVASKFLLPFLGQVGASKDQCLA